MSDDILLHFLERVYSVPGQYSPGPGDGLISLARSLALSSPVHLHGGSGIQVMTAYTASLP